MSKRFWSVVGVGIMLAVPVTGRAREIPRSIFGELRERIASVSSAEVLVTFRDEAALRASLPRFAARSGLRLRTEPILAFTASRDEILALGSDPGVERIDADERLPLLLPSATHASRARAIWDVEDGGPIRIGGRVVDGRRIGIAVIDSGIDSSHPDLRGRVVKNFRVASDRVLGDAFEAFSGEGRGPVDDQDVLIEVENSEIADGHGTHVSGIALGDGTASGGRVRGAAPGARLYGFGAGVSHAIIASNAAAALDWILQNHDSVDPPIRVVSNSWGTMAEFDADNPVTRLATKLVQQGIVVTWAAGNGDALENGGVCEDDRLVSYAKNPIPGLISVANYDDGDTGTRDGTLHRSSSRGSTGDPSTWPDVAAPGSSITSAMNLASEGLAIAANEYAGSLGYSTDPNPLARPFAQHKGTVQFDLGNQMSGDAPLDWTTWTHPVAIYDAHHNRFADAGPDPRLFHPNGGTGPIARPSDAERSVAAGDRLLLTKETGGTNPIRVQVTSPSGTSKTFSVMFTCGSSPCHLGIVTFIDGLDAQGRAEIDLGSAFAGEPADGTWTITPGPTDPTVAPFDPWYTNSSGTSMAAPHVAGIVALMLDANPALTPAQVEDVIEDTAHKFASAGPYSQDPANPGSSSSCGGGHGLVDARAAVERALAML